MDFRGFLVTGNIPTGGEKAPKGQECGNLASGACHHPGLPRPRQLRAGRGGRRGKELCSGEAALPVGSKSPAAPGEGCGESGAHPAESDRDD